MVLENCSAGRSFSIAGILLSHKNTELMNRLMDQWIMDAYA